MLEVTSCPSTKSETGGPSGRSMSVVHGRRGEFIGIVGESEMREVPRCCSPSPATRSPAEVAAGTFTSTAEPGRVTDGRFRDPLE